MKLYHAMIWSPNPNAPGQRVTVLAEDLNAARKMLEAQHGVGNVYDLHNKEDAARPR